MESLQNLINGPNKLTLFRIATVPIIVILLLFPNELCTFIAALLFSAAAITDYLDGFYARKRGLVSTLGKIMDPIADKLLVSSAFIMLTSLGWIPAWMVCVIIGRELAVTGLRNIIAEKGEDVSASNLGKYKTGFQIAAEIQNGFSDCRHYSVNDALSNLGPQRTGHRHIIFVGSSGVHHLVRG
jgi:CDP-diacylglycerol--glycerol-3-phosphate 3-phosphatidyltransferase